MNNAGKIAVWLFISTAVALTGCAPDAVNADVGTAAEADETCRPGYEYVPEVGGCISVPYQVDHTPGAFGCPKGGIRSAAGRVFCF